MTSLDNPGKYLTGLEVFGIFGKSSAMKSIYNLKKMNNVTNSPLGFV